MLLARLEGFPAQSAHFIVDGRVGQELDIREDTWMDGKDVDGRDGADMDGRNIVLSAQY